MFEEYVQDFYLEYQNLGDLYIFALLLVNVNRVYIVPIKRFSRIKPELSTQETQQVVNFQKWMKDNKGNQHR